MSNKRAGRPKGLRNTKPSREALTNYQRLLRDAADKGDPNAISWLLSLYGPQEARHG